MLKSIRTLVLSAAVATAAFVSPVLALTQDQKTEIESVVRDYLLKNPELIQETLVELDRRQKDAEAQMRRRITADKDGPLLTGKNNVVLGNPKGDITVVEFFDYNCGYCKRGLADLQTLIKEDKNVRIILKDFPVLSQGSRDAATVALAVKQQLTPEKYFDFHVRLMNMKGSIGRPQALEAAKDSGVDIAKLEKDIENPEVATSLDETRRLADGLGLTGTPTYVIGDDVVVGAVGYDTLRNRISNFRRCGKGRC